AEASLRALSDAGLTIRDVDGIATARPFPIAVAHHLGIEARWIDGTAIGGGSFLSHVRHAAAAIAHGDASVVLISHGESGRSRVGMAGLPADPASPRGQFEDPYGANLPVTTFTLPALRFLHERGFTIEALAHVAVAQRRWARDNPRAARHTA